MDDPIDEGSLDPQDAEFAPDDELIEEDHGADRGPAPRRGMIVVGVLIAAIAIGGGLGYAYRLAVGHAAGGGTTPVLIADKTPVKSQPPDAGGKTSDADKKTIFDRLSPDGTSSDGQMAAAAPSQENVAVDSGGDGQDSVAGPHKVSTVSVTPGQAIPLQQFASTDNSVPLTVAVPAGGSSPAASQAMAPAKGAKVVAPAPDDSNQAADAATPDVSTSDGNSAPAMGAAANDGQDGSAVPMQPKVPAKPSKKLAKAPAPAPAPDAGDGTDQTAQASDQSDANAAPQAPSKQARVKVASADATSGGGTNGYVAQLKSSKSQADALSAFADLQQRYSDLLSSAQPDIQMVDLGAKGKWYRLRIGPPGSSAAAKDLCNKLKVSGLKECIVAAY
jgi:hypothetical protein